MESFVRRLNCGEGRRKRLIAERWGKTWNKREFDRGSIKKCLKRKQGIWLIASNSAVVVVVLGEYAYAIGLQH